MPRTPSFALFAKGLDFDYRRECLFRNRDRLYLKLHQSRQGRLVIARHVSESRLAGMRNKCRETEKEIPSALPKARAQRSGAR